MLVVVLIGITATYIVLNLDRDQDQIALLEAKRFASLLNHIRDESVLVGRPLAVEVDDFDGQYSFLKLEKTKWVVAGKDPVLRPRRFPEMLEIEFKLLQPAGKGKSEKKKKAVRRDKEEENDKDKEKERDLVIAEPGGTLTPFLLSIRGDEETYKVTVDNTYRVIVGQDEEAR